MGGLRAASALAVVSLALGAADGCKPDPMREIISFPARDAAVSCGDASASMTAATSESAWVARAMAEVEAGDAGPSAADGLCDGTTSVRLAVSFESGGGLAPVSPFSFPHGRFFVLDGRCRFIAQNDALAGLHNGTLTQRQAGELAADLAVADLASLHSTRATCVDGWVTLIAASTAAVSCSCSDCGADTFADSVMERAELWLDRLFLLGVPIVGPVRALAAPRAPPSMLSCGHALSAIAWPLTRSMLDVPGLVVDDAGRRAAGAVFDDPDEAAALRAVRAQAAAMPFLPSLPPSIAYVRDAGVSYAIYIRDELPAEQAQAVDAFFATAWASQPRGPNGSSR
jgi:hypothetical protein